MNFNDKYLHNDHFYLTCNNCERLIKKSEMSEDEYEEGNGYCPECDIRKPVKTLTLNKLVDRVVEQIKMDIDDGDITSLITMLKRVNVRDLKSYLPEV